MGRVLAPTVVMARHPLRQEKMEKRYGALGEESDDGAEKPAPAEGSMAEAPGTKTDEAECTGNAAGQDDVASSASVVTEKRKWAALNRSGSTISLSGSAAASVQTPASKKRCSEDGGSSRRGPPAGSPQDQKAAYWVGN